MTAHSLRVTSRADLVLEFLEDNGPSVITRIAAALMLAVHLVRYALVTLREEGRAYISEFIRALGADDRTKYIAVFAAGEGEDAVLPFTKEDETLEFGTGLEVQSIYIRWTGERAHAPPEELEDY